MTTEINSRMIPEFEEKIIEQKERTQIVQDWKGNICEISNEYDVSNLRPYVWRAPVTRRWIKCPVESWKDWKQMKERYNVNDSRRFPLNFEKDFEMVNRQEKLVKVNFCGLFY